MQAVTVFPLSVKLKKQSYNFIQGIYSKCSYSKATSKMEANELKMKTQGQLFILDLTSFLDSNLYKIKFFKNYMQFVVRLAYKLKIIPELTVNHEKFIAQSMPKLNQKLSLFTQNDRKYQLLVQFLQKINTADEQNIKQRLKKDIKQANLGAQKQALISITNNIYQAKPSPNQTSLIQQKNDQNQKLIYNLKEEIQIYKKKLEQLQLQQTTKQKLLKETHVCKSSKKTEQKVDFLQSLLLKYQNEAIVNEQKFNNVKKQCQQVHLQYSILKKVKMEQNMNQIKAQLQNNIALLRKNQLLKQNYENLMEVYNKQKKEVDSNRNINICEFQIKLNRASSIQNDDK